MLKRINLLLLSPLCLLLAVLMFTSCSRHSAVWPQLLEAEQLLETDLQSAGAMIDSLDATPLEGEDAALYAILKTQADWKRYLPLTSDSLPRLATDYYGTPYRKNYHAAMAWYSLGCYFLDQRLDLEAIEAFLKAKSLFPGTLSRYYALCEQQLGKLYLLHHLYSQSLEEFTAYKDAAIQKGDSKLMPMADYFCALAKIRLQQFDEAKSLLIPLSDTSCTTFSYYNDVFLQLGKIEYLMNNFDESMSYLDRYISGLKNSNSLGVAYLLKGNIYYDTNRYDSAHSYYLQALESSNDLNTKCETNKMLSYTKHLLEGDTLSSGYATTYALLLDSIYRQSHKSEIASIQVNHALELQGQRLKTDKLRFVFLTLLSSVVLISCAIIMLLTYHRRKERQYIAYSEKIRESICEQIKLQVCSEPSEDIIEEDALADDACQEDADALLDAADGSFNPLVFALREERIQCCCEQFSKSEWGAYLKKKHEAILREEYMKINDRELFRSYVSRLFSEILLELVNESKPMNDEYLFICQLCMLGLSGKAIGHCMGTTAHSVYCRKTRIKEYLNSEWKRHVFRPVGEQ